MEYVHFFSFDIDKTVALVTRYNAVLVVSSVLIAILAGYSFYAIDELVAFKEDSKKRKIYTFIGGVMLAFGVWNMHFIGMLSLDLGIEVKYDYFVSVLSLLPIFLSAISVIYFLSIKDKSFNQTLLYGLLLALGITSMHFIGMSAMSMNSIMVHDPILFSISFFISWGLAVVSLFVSSYHKRLSDKLSNNWGLAISSIIFGGAISIMHYIAMWSVYFIPVNYEVAIEGVPINSVKNTLVVSAIAFVACLYFILRLKGQVLRFRENIRNKKTQIIDIVDHIAEPFIFVDPNGKILFVNQSFYSQFPDMSSFWRQSDDIKKFMLVFSFVYDKEAQLDLNLADKDIYEQTFKSKDNLIWLFKKYKSFSSNTTYQWTDISNEISKQEELLATKDQAYDSLKLLQQKEIELLEAKRFTAIGRLVNNLAHELNTPLGITLTSLSCIDNDSEQIEKLLNEDKLSRQYLQKYLIKMSEYQSLGQSNLLKVSDIIDKLKLVTNVDIEPKYQVINLKGYIDSIQLSLNSTMTKVDTQLEIDIDDDIQIVTETTALFQVFQILYENSIEHAFGGGPIGKVRLSAVKRQGGISIYFADNGLGISKHIENDIFEPFISGRKYERGSGLGLYVAHNIVKKRLNGEIKLQHSGEDGSVFKITLPHLAKKDSWFDTELDTRLMLQPII